MAAADKSLPMKAQEVDDEALGMNEQEDDDEAPGMNEQEDDDEAQGMKFVAVRSKDRHVFYVPRAAALQSSEKVCNLLDHETDAGNEDSLYLPYPAFAVHIICKYMMYKAHYSNATGPVPAFDIQVKDAMFVMDAALFLDL